MIFARTLSIRTKLIFLATLSGCCAVVLTSGVFVWVDHRTVQKTKIERLKLHARFLSFEALGAVEDGDEAAASEVLSRLGLERSVRQACLYDMHGHPIAEYARADSEPLPIPDVGPDGFSMARQGILELSVPIMTDGTRIGTIYLLDDNPDVNQRVFGYSRIAVLVTLFSCGLSLLLSIPLQSELARPILSLARTAREVTTNHDYSLRVTPPGRDEIGDLCRSFNQMLEQIEIAQDQVRDARTRQEENIAQRTTQLRMEIAERKKIEADLVRAKDAAVNASQSQERLSGEHESRDSHSAECDPRLQRIAASRGRQDL